MKLKFVEQIGQIRDETEFPIAYMDRLAHERFPDLARQLAAAPEMLWLLREAMPGLNDLVAQDCPQPEAAARDIEIRDKVKALLERLGKAWP